MKAFVWIAVAIIVLGGAYFYRNQIQSLFMGASPAPISYTSGSSSALPTSSGKIISWMNGSKGQYAVGPNGMTLYWSNKDTSGKSNCSGNCAGIWPPYTTTTSPTTLPAGITLIKRDDGSMQFAYKGMPLYYFSGDQKPGDANGDGYNSGQWHLVTP